MSDNQETTTQDFIGRLRQAPRLALTQLFSKKAADQQNATPPAGTYERMFEIDRRDTGFGKSQRAIELHQIRIDANGKPTYQVTQANVNFVLGVPISQEETSKPKTLGYQDVKGVTIELTSIVVYEMSWAC